MPELASFSVKRTQTQISVWPAIADLMTVFAVFGLTVAVASGGCETGDPAKPDSGNDSLQTIIAELKGALTSLEIEQESLLRELAESRFGVNPCLGVEGDESESPDVMLDIWLGESYLVQRAWADEDHHRVVDIPQIDEFMDVNSEQRQRMSRQEFLRFADSAYRFGETQGCKYFVNLFNNGLDKSEFYTGKEEEVAKYFFFC